MDAVLRREIKHGDDSAQLPSPSTSGIGCGTTHRFGTKQLDACLLLWTGQDRLVGIEHNLVRTSGRGYME